MITTGRGTQSQLMWEGWNENPFKSLIPAGLGVDLVGICSRTTRPSPTASLAIQW